MNCLRLSLHVLSYQFEIFIFQNLKINGILLGSYKMEYVKFITPPILNILNRILLYFEPAIVRQKDTQTKTRSVCLVKTALAKRNL